MILKYSISRSGVVLDAISINKYHEMGNPDDPFYPSEGWEGMPGIRIERKYGKECRLVYNTVEDRDKEYESLLRQIYDQS